MIDILNFPVTYGFPGDALYIGQTSFSSKIFESFYDCTYLDLFDTLTALFHILNVPLKSPLKKNTHHLSVSILSPYINIF